VTRLLARSLADAVKVTLVIIWINGAAPAV
jgi:hypothetical protein